MPSLNLENRVPTDWASALQAEIEAESFACLSSYLEREYAHEVVFPKQEDIFNALALTPFEDVKVVLIGQDPYHGEGQANGLAFSVQDGVRIPPSLRNIFKELNSDLSLPIPEQGDLSAWAKQGVLLLNTALTVRESQPASHAGQGWEDLTDGVIRSFNERGDGVVFLLWGNHAKKKKALIDQGKHIIIENAHPSPLSASRGFFDSKPFSKTNAALEAQGHSPIDWAL